MIMTGYFAVPSIRTRKSTPLRFFKTLADAALQLIARRHKRRHITALYRLDDRLLADIGVTRGDVMAALSVSHGEDPGMLLQRLTHERRANERANAAENRRGLRDAQLTATGHNHEREQ